MVILNKLYISGIRSFHPEDNPPQIIKFSSPLTLFLGQNGCGKTTVIECLKYACSGELPGGSSRGQGFVYDPKMNATTMSRGQIKLRFFHENNKEYTVFKSMTVTLKKDKLTFAKQDNSLKVKALDKNKEDVISGKCTDVENEICELMGVSKAILNNVIFCHQEDSLWPMDEASKLKKKFDEIFEVTQYHKCADHIRKLIKEKHDKIKVLNVELLYRKDKKKDLDKRNSELAEKEQKRETIIADISEKEKRIEPIKSRLQEICNLQNQLNHLQQELSAKVAENKNIVEQIDTILRNIKNKEFEGTDAELKEEINNFDNNRRNVEEKLKEFEKEKANIEDQEALITKKKSKLLAELGKLQAEEKTHKENINNRKQLFKKIAHNLEIDAESEITDDINVDNVMRLIKGGMDKLKEALANLTKEVEAKEATLQKEIDNCRDNVRKAQHSIESKNNQIKESKKKSRDINSQLQELSVSDDQLQTLKNKIATLDKELRTVKEKFEEQEISQSTIDKEKSNIKDLEEKLEELEEERKILLQNSITEAEIENRRLEIKKRESDINKLKNKHYDNFQLIFPDGIPKINLKGAVENMRSIHSKKVTELSNKINTQQKLLSNKEAQLKFVKEKLQSLEDELKTNMKKTSEHCPGQTYEKRKSDLTALTEKLRRDKGQYSSAKVMYQKFIEDFEKDKCCPLCRTEFSDKEQVVAELIAEIKNKIKEIPSKLKKVEAELKQKETELDAVTALKPLNDKIKEISDVSIPTVQLEIDEVEKECEKLKEELQEMKEELKEPQKLESVCTAVLSDAALIDQNGLEINNSRTAVENLNAQIVTVPSSRTRQETETEIETIKMELTNARRNCETSLKRLQQYNNRCQDLRETRSKFVQKQLDIQKVMQGKPQLEEQLVELSEKENLLEKEIAELQSSLEPLQKKLSEAEKKKITVRDENKKVVELKRLNFFENEKLLDRIEKYTKQIDDYINENKEDTFEKTVEKSVELEELLQKLTESKKKVTEEIGETKRKYGNLELHYRNLTDNFELREKRKKQQVFEREIELLRNQIGEHDEKSLSTKKLQLESEASSVIQDIHSLKGRKSELEISIKELKAELDKPELKLAGLYYKSKFYEVKVTEQILQDLKEYLAAYEYSVMHFHKERMVQINKSIKNYWRSIYRGNDIDYIEIKTEQDTSPSARRRVYNYKVIQVKADVELEMRGRCSAGQKVLASLIIRMALAETFCRNCGILALDEPTTNLDRANILSLSQALATIVDDRSSDKNFQLLVITHDEEFLNALATVDKVRYINKVSRNEKGNSVITVEYL